MEKAMLNAKKVAGFAIATAAAGLFMAGATTTAFAASYGKETAKVHCLGANACKGQSDCATASSSCKGQNSCKGQGMKVLSLKECQTVGGKPEKPKG
jgi:uncharacterized membrane protein